jgi:hypothetical protein
MHCTDDMSLVSARGLRVGFGGFAKTIFCFLTGKYTAAFAQNYGTAG